MAAKEADCHDALPVLITANEMGCFDSFKHLKCEVKSSAPAVFEIEAANIEKDGESKPQRTRSISISMPSSPIEAHLRKTIDEAEANSEKVEAKTPKFYSQILLPKYSAMDPVYDNRFDSFKTWSGKLERHHGEQIQAPPPQSQVLPVNRYFDALEGPELDTLRASEEIILPEDKQWPFLLRFPINAFGICLGVGSQAMMFKNLSFSATTAFLHVSPRFNLALWLISAALTVAVASVYALKIIFYFEAVRREYYHPVRVNFFFAPWIALLFLALGVPPSIAPTLHSSLWYILMAPIVCLEVKIYGQWMLGGERRLSKVANPSNHLSVVGNFIGALLGASMGIKEGALFFFAVGMAHYIVLFVTLYQRLPTNETLPEELHPVFFLFVTAPGVASMAWARIQGDFDFGSRIAYFIALFLYVSLGVRVNFFRGFRFSLAWWAYTFPMTGTAIATIKYSIAVRCKATQILAVSLCVVAVVAVAALLVNTVVHALVHRDLFPNDMAIAISTRRPKPRWYHKSSDTSIDQYLKYSESDCEASHNNL